MPIPRSTLGDRGGERLHPEEVKNRGGIVFEQQKIRLRSRFEKWA